MTEEVYRAYNPARVTLDTHADETLARMQIRNAHDDVFIRQVGGHTVAMAEATGSNDQRRWCRNPIPEGAEGLG